MPSYAVFRTKVTAPFTALLIIVLLPAVARSDPTGAAASVSITRANDTPHVVDEGGAIGVTINVINAERGQTFDLRHSNTMNAADFLNTLAADLASSELPAGISISAHNALEVTVTLTPGSYSFNLHRRVAVDGIVEPMDQAPWVSGNQEQSDIFIDNPTGELQIGSYVVSTWVSDR